MNKYIIFIINLLVLGLLSSCSPKTEKQKIYFIPCSDYIVCDSSKQYIEVPLFFFHEGSNSIILSESKQVRLIGEEDITAVTSKLIPSKDNLEYNIITLELKFDIYHIKKDTMEFNKLSIYNKGKSDYIEYPIGSVIISKICGNQAENMISLGEKHPLVSSSSTDYHYNIINTCNNVIHNIELMLSNNRTIKLSNKLEVNKCLSDKVTVGLEDYPISYVRPAIIFKHKNSNYYFIMPPTYMGALKVDKSVLDIAIEFYNEKSK